MDVIDPMLPNKPRGVLRVDDRRVTIRYGKLAANYLAFIQLASIRIWRRANESAPRLAAHGDLYPAPEWNLDRSKTIGGIPDVSEVVTIFGFKSPGIVTEHECAGSQA